MKKFMPVDFCEKPSDKDCPHGVGADWCCGDFWAKKANERLAEMLAEAPYDYCEPGSLLHQPEYNAEYDNYYCKLCRKGMGNDYYKLAREHAALKEKLSTTEVYLQANKDKVDARDIEIRELQDEVESLQFNLEQKAGEIGCAEHRGNTVNYIYDKCELYGKQLIEQHNKITYLQEENQENALLLLKRERLHFDELARFRSALMQIASEKHYVESQSTGMKQWFPIQGAKIASEALVRCNSSTGHWGEPTCDCGAISIAKDGVVTLNGRKK